MDDGSAGSIVVLALIVGAVIVIGGLLVGATTYKEKFERNFIFNGAAWGIMISEIIMFIGAMIAETPNFSYLLTFGHVGGSVWFYFGAIILLITFANNISQSNFKWGMFQNIMQMILVTLFSVIIIAGTMFAKQKISDVLNK